MFMKTKPASLWGQLLTRLRLWLGGRDAGPDRRQGVRCLSGVATLCRPAQGPADHSWPGLVQDVSLAGICLRVDQAPAEGMLLHVDVPGGPSQGESLLACVNNVRPGQEGSWNLGCSFIRELTEPEFRRFLGG
jgi:hypothetical protein